MEGETSFVFKFEFEFELHDIGQLHRTVILYEKFKTIIIVIQDVN